MSLPVDPILDCNAAQYSLKHNKNRVHLTRSQDENKMFTPRIVQQSQQQQLTQSFPDGRIERFRDYIGQRCCSCFLRLPIVVIVIALCVIVALLLALIPAVIILTSTTDAEALQQFSPKIQMEILRETHVLPSVDPLDDEQNDVVNELRSYVVENVHGISSSALFPPNVSLCGGFGFACTILPSMIISTTLRCDGKKCQSAFSCSLSNKTEIKVCLRAEQLCDGIPHCPNEQDEKEHCKMLCDKGELRCPATSLCLPWNSVCDGIVDCDTEDDETNCMNCTRGALFCQPTKRCIPAGQVCDGFPHCPDRSDEMNCDCRGCSGSDKALCADGQCIERSRICDGIPDCSEGIDEKDCPGTCILEKSEEASNSIPYITCANGRLYPQAEACSGIIEQCVYNCTKCDEHLAFTCNDRKCVPQMLVCDGIEDCSEGEDEENCICGDSDKFECNSASGKAKCISKHRVCDGVWDCMSGKDEMNCSTCPTNSLRCEHEGKCIPKIARCDGIADCLNGSDETNCTCEECIGHHWNTYMCGTRSHCFRRDEVCAPYTLCPNATTADKVYCAGRAVKDTNWFK
ncbi:Low-density lipoprotein receptor domain class A [Dictyocaulus viviparus]|uniref:Low-density lipoprotein receptor domain class A n=1 Tax=Dictyocaulus viviparus TaxID=29172 RepID=A0A0D8XPF7_DICVI|nr:Low-density lipoprotein receptor domain class A [Dictyocaulus viviparus]